MQMPQKKKKKLYFFFNLSGHNGKVGLSPYPYNARKKMKRSEKKQTKILETK